MAIVQRLNSFPPGILLRGIRLLCSYRDIYMMGIFFLQYITRFINVLGNFSRNTSIKILIIAILYSINKGIWPSEGDESINRAFQNK